MQPADPLQLEALEIVDMASVDARRARVQLPSASTIKTLSCQSSRLQDLKLGPPRTPTVQSLLYCPAYAFALFPSCFLATRGHTGEWERWDWLGPAGSTGPAPLPSSGSRCLRRFSSHVALRTYALAACGWPGPLPPGPVTSRPPPLARPTRLPRLRLTSEHRTHTEARFNPSPCPAPRTVLMPLALA